MGIPFWGVKCKGCGSMHPVVMFRNGDKESPFPIVQYQCPSGSEQAYLPPGSREPALLELSTPDDG